MLVRIKIEKKNQRGGPFKKKDRKCHNGVL